MKIIFFDARCNFCDSFINFIVKRDERKIFNLCGFQSESGRKLGEKYGFESENLSSVIFVKDEKVFRKSHAVIKILCELGGLWRMTSLLLLIPKFIGDFFYDWFGKNRYRWFGKKENCEIFSDEINQRLIK